MKYNLLNNFEFGGALFYPCYGYARESLRIKSTGLGYPIYMLAAIFVKCCYVRVGLHNTFTC